MARRERHEMAEDIRVELAARGLMDAYNARPAYQRNDYLGWIQRAVKVETRSKRLQQMLTELALGGVYMGMDHPPSRRA